MDCSRFEAELVELLSEPVHGENRRARAGRLTAHARACADCRGSLDLLDWRALPAGERDGFDEPGDRYWESFDGRLGRRIERDRSPRPRTTWLTFAAALFLGVALLAVWHLRPEQPVTLPVESVALADEAFDGLLGTLDDWYGVDLGSADGGALGTGDGALLPSTADLDGEARRDLLDWLREEASRLDGGSA